MKPLLALTVHQSFGQVAPEYVADLINGAMDREFRRAGVPVVSVRVLETPEDLRAYLAGEMVLYRKPARRHGNKIVYEREGQRVELEQLTLEGKREGEATR